MQPSRCLRRSGCFVLAALIVFCAACGVKDTTSGGTTTTSSSGTTTTAPLLLSLTTTGTNAGIVSLYATVSQVTLTPYSGSGTVTVYTGTTPVELTRLDGATRYLARVALPSGSYTKATATLTDLLVTYINSDGDTVTEEFPSASGTFSALFPELVTVGTAPVEVSLNLDLQNSLALTAASGTLAITPTMSVSEASVASVPGFQDGLLEGVTGTVAGYSSSLLKLTTDVGAFAFNCNITSSTTTSDYTASSGLAQGALVRASLALNSGSNFDCESIEALDSSNISFALAGTVNSIRGTTSPYQFTLVQQDATGAGTTANDDGHGINVNLSAATFDVDWEGISQTNLGFTPTFGLTTLFPSQYVEAVSDSSLLTTGTNVGTIADSLTTVAAMNATTVTLRKQGIEGTPSSVVVDANNVTTFTLTVGSDSVFAQYTASPSNASTFKPTIQVVVPAASTITGSLTTSLADAPADTDPYVQVRGLLFLNGTTYTMVAERVTAILPPTDTSSSSSSTSTTTCTTTTTTNSSSSTTTTTTCTTS